ncbi:hypothetical protein NK214_06595 [Chromobacterium sp. S0633]|uniref:hypothetical protein n=1 Tax=Chromobacterium sp. S0633 TaxID=2957805 RepID=UPI00209DBCE3|nr:hypothetical protein [Chromobacterium sp. S0633]MCP1289858.1 hypothetical protein [Chromobacterium sp. S0633]
MTTIKLIQPVKPRRDELGHWIHPGIPNFNEDTGAYTAWLKEQRLTLHHACLEEENDDHPAVRRYQDTGSSDVSDWHPAPPAGDGWFLLGIYDTDNDMVATFAKRAEPEQTQCTCGPVRHWECNAGCKARGAPDGR